MEGWNERNPQGRSHFFENINWNDKGNDVKLLQTDHLTAQFFKVTPQMALGIYEEDVSWGSKVFGFRSFGIWQADSLNVFSVCKKALW